MPPLRDAMPHHDGARGAAVGCAGVVDPDRIVHVRLHVLVAQHAAAERAAGIAEQKDAAARLPLVVAIADQQHAMAVLNPVARTHLQHAIVPFCEPPLRPKEPAADRPAPRSVRLIAASC